MGRKLTSIGMLMVRLQYSEKVREKNRNKNGESDWGRGAYQRRKDYGGSAKHDLVSDVVSRDGSEG